MLKMILKKTSLLSTLYSLLSTLYSLLSLATEARVAKGLWKFLFYRKLTASAATGPVELVVPWHAMLQLCDVLLSPHRSQEKWFCFGKSSTR